MESEIKVAFSFDNLPPEITKITISSNASSFQGKVEFSPLLPAHRGMMYGCASVTESKNSTSFVVPATNPAANWTLELEGEQQYVHYARVCSISTNKASEATPVTAFVPLLAKRAHKTDCHG